MTIRLRCAACNRKLKVPDEALGKKVQCPMCGARFIGRQEASPPAETPSHAESPIEVPVIDALFAEMGASAPLSAAEGAEPPLPRMELEETAAKAKSADLEPLEPEVLDEEEPVSLEEEDIEIIEEEAEDAEDDSPRKKKSRKGLVFLLAAMVLVLLLGCGGGGFLVYRWFNGDNAPATMPRRTTFPAPMPR